MHEWLLSPWKDAQCRWPLGTQIKMATRRRLLAARWGGAGFRGDRTGSDQCPRGRGHTGPSQAAGGHSGAASSPTASRVAEPALPRARPGSQGLQSRCQRPESPGRARGGPERRSQLLRAEAAQSLPSDAQVKRTWLLRTRERHSATTGPEPETRRLAGRTGSRAPEHVPGSATRGSPECPAPAVFTGLREPLAVFAFGPAHLRGGPIACGVRTPRLPSAPVYVCGRVPFARHHSTFHIFAEGLSVRLRAAAALGAGCCRGRRGPGRGPGQALSCPPACPGHSCPYGFCGPDTGLGLLPALFQEPLQG